VLHRLVEQADVVQHNMRYDAAERLGVDYGSLRAINPALIYCHTRGFEHGPRETLPGNDQTGAALAGTEWLDGGLDHGGNPVWSTTSLGDTGNGFLSAIGMVQALAHRDRTGEGQFLDTAIVYAQLLNASSAWVTPDGAIAGRRPSLDADQLGWSALYRVYPCADATWLCVVALGEATFAALADAVGRGDLAADDRFGDHAARAANDGALVTELTAVFAARPAAHWFAVLDAAGVPCEVSDPDFVLSMFDDPELIERGWVTSYEHRHVGRIDTMGLLFDLSDTPGRIAGPPFVPGQHTGPILRELGYDDEEIAALAASRVVLDRS
jgi:crotonobetainyl-CoA:carnitine CoA-transferase CaiB-like acyl-CoA transferase